MIAAFTCLCLGHIPALDISAASYAILGVVVVLKVLLFIYCRWANTFSAVKSDSLEALAEDHLNDVMSNMAAIITASLAFNFR
jgi:divalent metal cation (Fe/Co/Zn/Cd) transporter